MNYCYKIEYVDDSNCSAKVKYYVKNYESTVFIETNVDLPVTSTGTVVTNEDLHLYISNMVPRRFLTKQYAIVYDQSGINAVNTLTNIEFDVDILQSGTDVDVTAYINEILTSNTGTNVTTGV